MKKVFVIIVVLCLAFVGCSCARNGKSMPMIAETNYNNYAVENEIDIRYGNIAREKGNKIVYTEADGSRFTVKDANTPRLISENEMLYLKDNDLYLMNTDSRESKLIIEGVYRYSVCGNLIVYSPKYADNVRSGLYVYDMSAPGEEIRSLIYDDNIEALLICNEKLYIVSNSYPYGIYEVSMTDGTKNKIISFEKRTEMYGTVMQGDNFIYFNGDNQLCSMSAQNGEIKSISVFNETYSNNFASLVCDDETIFYSFRATNTNGSIITFKSSEYNGLWRVDPVTMEKTKISDWCFSSLYLLDGRLYGINSFGRLCEINVDTGKVNRIAR